MPEVADLCHVRRHDAVAFLGHPLDFFHAAHGLDAEPEKENAQLLPRRDHLSDVLAQLLVRTMDVRALLAGELQLRARLQRDRRTPGSFESDHVLAFRRAAASRIGPRSAAERLAASGRSIEPRALCCLTPTFSYSVPIFQRPRLRAARVRDSASNPPPNASAASVW